MTETKFKIGSKELQIEPTKIYWDNKLINNLVENPTQIRFGIAPIELDMFTIGTNFIIQVRNEKKHQLNISLKSYFGIGSNRRHQLFEQITDAIWDTYFESPFAELIEKWESGETLEVSKFLIDQKGLSKKVGPRNVTIAFDEMTLFPRFDHLLINSSTQSDKFMKIHYLDHWNWPLVSQIIDLKVNPDS